MRVVFSLLLGVVVYSAAGQTPPPVGAPPPLAVRQQLLSLQQRLSEAAEQFRKPVSPGSLPGASSGALETSFALASLQVAKGLDYTALDLPLQAGIQLEKARKVLQRKLSSVPRGRLSERAYFARNDDSPQPWFFFKPSRYDGETPLPLVVFLHGYVPETSRTHPYLVSDFVLDLAEQYQTLFAIPHGRTNTDFQYAGEVDVLRVLAEVKRFHPVDPDRVYLLGVSMGGAGVWHVSTHYPDAFAAVAPINAQADWFKFWHELFRYPPRRQLPRHIQFLFAMNNPLDLAGNLSNVYSYSQHATRCFVGVGHTRSMVARFKSLEIPHDFYEDPSELGHYIYWEKDCWARAFKKLFEHTRSDIPRRLNFTTYSLRFPGTHWAEITAMETWGRPAAFSGHFPAEGPLEISTDNILSLKITIPDGWLPDAETISIIWNEAPLTLPVLLQDGVRTTELCRTGADSVSAPAICRKSQAVCGPAADVFNFPFIIVQGTKGSPESQRRNKKLAQQLSRDWEAYAEGDPPIIKDKDVTPEIMSTHGLVLIGFPDENMIFAAFADRFPIQVTESAIKLPDGKSFSRAKHGLIMTQPNPKFPDRYLLVYAGLPWGGGRSSNHKFDCLPDFSIYTGQIVLPMGYNAYAAAGLFDRNWNYQTTLTDFAPDNDSKPPPEQ